MNISWRTATVRQVTQCGTAQELVVEVLGQLEKAVNFQQLTGNVSPGDRVILNTTAVELGLGSGGVHFVAAKLPPSAEPLSGPGHIMKLRYTPLQFKCLSVEEQASPHHDVMTKARSLEGTPVIALELHSQLLPALFGVRHAWPDAKVGYVMTDGGALPIALSRTVRQLERDGVIDFSVTAGHAFGGTYEAVNIASALLAARAVGRADVIVAGMGPGIVGTATAFGHTGVDQAMIANTTRALGGRPVFSVRINAGDVRARHTGLSHHTLSALALTLLPVVVVFPKGCPAAIRRQWARSRAGTRHPAVVAPWEEAMTAACGSGYQLSTMGRGPSEEPWFFRAACAAGVYAGNMGRKRANGKNNRDRAGL